MSTITNDNVTSTIVLSLDAIVKYFQSVLPGVSFVYDENLGYESGMNELRASNSLRDQFKNKLPCFFFKRSVLRAVEQGMGRRSSTQEVIDPNFADGTVGAYNTIQGMFDLEFLFITTSMSELENFEVSWLSQNGITALKQVNVSLPQLGDVPYYLRYDPLVDKNINSTGNYYKSINGIMQVTGWFFAFNPNDSANLKLIKEINANVLAFSTGGSDALPPGFSSAPTENAIRDVLGHGPGSDANGRVPYPGTTPVVNQTDGSNIFEQKLGPAPIGIVEVVPENANVDNGKVKVTIT